MKKFMKIVWNCNGISPKTSIFEKLKHRLYRISGNLFKATLTEVDFAKTSVFSKLAEETDVKSHNCKHFVHKDWFVFGLISRVNSSINIQII